MKQCIFCNIANKRVPAKILFEDKFVMAIESKEKVNPGHVLLISKQHFENILDTDSEVLKDLGLQMRNVGKKIIRLNKAEGLNILNANGKVAQQSVNHLHFHLVPRFENDRLDLWIKQKL